MNSLKLLIENFQSISQGSLEFQTGLNFLIGQSNSGKSAIFRALKACLSNPSGSQRYIKHGSKQSTVTLKYNDNEIIWRRTPKESSYEINGEVYVKTGSSSAFKILEDSTGFVKDGNSDVIYNIEEELQLLFPFGISKSDLFKLYENVFCISDSATILKSAKEQEDVVKSKIGELGADLSKTLLKLEELRKFREETDINLLKEYREALKRKNNRVLCLKDGLNLIKVAAKVASISIPKKAELRGSLTCYNEKLKDRKIFELTKECHAFLKSTSGNTLNVDSSKLSNYEELKNLKRIISTLKSLEKITPSSFKFCSRLEKLKELQDLQESKEVLKKLKSFTMPLLETRDLYNDYQDLKDLSKYLKKINNLINEKNCTIREIEEKVREIGTKLRAFRVCPLCHQEIKGDKYERDI